LEVERVNRSGAAPMLWPVRSRVALLRVRLAVLRPVPVPLVMLPLRVTVPPVRSRRRVVPTPAVRMRLLVLASRRW